MQFARQASAVHPRRFGRRASYQSAEVPAARVPIADDLKLFATTFAAGFVFVTVLLA
jgi:hypothetical protein